MIKSMLTPSTIGNRPRIVVTEVSNTGLRRCAPVRRIASFAVFVVPFSRSKVSINTMLLLTPMPPIKGYYIGVIYISIPYTSPIFKPTVYSASLACGFWMRLLKQA